MKKYILFLFLLTTLISKGQTPTTILIQNDTIGNVGQYIANAIVVQTPCLGLTDTVFSVECYLIYKDNSGNTTSFPEEYSHFTVNGLVRSLYATPISQLPGWKNSIINTPNPHLILR